MKTFNKKQVLGTMFLMALVSFGAVACKAAGAGAGGNGGDATGTTAANTVVWIDLSATVPTDTVRDATLTFTFDEDVEGFNVSFDQAVTGGTPRKLDGTGVYAMDVSGIPDVETINVTVAKPNTAFDPSSTREWNVKDGTSQAPGATAPGPVADFAGLAGNAQVILNWSDPADSDLAKVNISFTPVKAGVAQPIVVNKGAEAVTVSGLENDVAYTFSAVTENTSGQKGASVDAGPYTPHAPDPADNTAPAPVTGLGGTPGNYNVELAWTNPADSDLSYIHITWTGGSENVDVIASTNSTKIINNLNLEAYTFTVTAFDVNGNESTPVSTGPHTPLDLTPPAEISNDLTAVADDSRVTLGWSANPADADYHHVEITHNQGGGTPARTVTPNTETTYIWTGLTNGTNYTFTVKTVDSAGNKSVGRTISATPNEWTVTFDFNGGDDATVGVPATGGHVVYPSGATFGKSGFVFVGWYDTVAPLSIGELAYYVEIPASAAEVPEGAAVSANKTLFAAWRQLPNVEFRDGGINDTTSATYSYQTLPAVFDGGGGGVQFRVPAYNLDGLTHPATPKYTGHSGVFSGWNTVYDGSGVTLNIGGVLPQSGDAPAGKLYAQWVNTSGEAALDALGDLVSQIQNELQSASASAYSDEFVVGSGSNAAASAEITTFMDELNVLLGEAALLLAGTQNSATVTTDQGPETIYWTVYDYPAIAAKHAAINEKKQDPLYAAALDMGGFAPAQVNLAYTGDVQSVTIAVTGTYEIEAYGASGGHIWSKNNLTATGGKGGHVSGRVNLAAGTVLKVRVGGEGTGTALFNQNSATFSKIDAGYTDAHAGGYNGGGNGGASNPVYSTGKYTAGGSGGGGATDIRIYDGTYSAGNNNYEKGVDNSVAGGTNEGLGRRIIVAAGGGGTAQASTIGSPENWPGIPGGDAGQNGILRGATSGTQGSYLYSVNGAWYGLQQESGGYQPPRAGNSSAPALSQMSTGGNGTTSGTQLGIGAAGQAGAIGSYAWEGTGGGGGGYYGGEALLGTARGNAATSSGAGGSNFADNGSIKTVSSPVIGLNSVYGNGKVVIRYVSP